MVQNSIPGRTMQFAPTLKLFAGAILVIALREPCQIAERKASLNCRKFSEYRRISFYEIQDLYNINNNTLFYLFLFRTDYNGSG